jgi:hypothetical protein
MDYARQNYVAQPGDGLAPEDFVRQLGPFDDFIIDWGYRVLPQAATPEAELPTLRQRLAEQHGRPMGYRYVPQDLTGIDPRAQTEDVGDDPVRASEYAIANLKRVVPNLVAWTTRPGEDYAELQELHGETLGMWSLYMGHVANVVGGVEIDYRTADQPGAVYRAVPRARQQEALRFLAAQAFRTPEWLAPRDIVSRIGPPPAARSVAGVQAGVVQQLLDVRRLARMADAERTDAANAYPVATYLSDLRSALWDGEGAAPDASRRALQRVHLERLGALVAPPAPAPGGQGAGGAPPRPIPSPLLALPNVLRSDLPALARAQVAAVRDLARRRAALAIAAMARAHWQDVVARAELVLDPAGRQER